MAWAALCWDGEAWAHDSWVYMNLEDVKIGTIGQKLAWLT